MAWRSYYWQIFLRVEDLKDAVGGRCFECGGRKQLEWAHLKPTALSGMGRGSHNRRLDLLQHLDCYSYLCKECHREFDKRGRTQPQSVAERLGGRVGEFSRAATEQSATVPF